MRKNLLISLSILCMLCLFTFAGCTADQSGASSEKTEELEKMTEVVSTDGKVKVSIPKDWKEEDLESEDAVLQLVNEKKAAYTLLINEDKQDYEEVFKLADYQKLIVDTMADSLGGTESSKKSEPVSIKVNNYEGIQCNLEGSIEGIKIKYIITCIDTGKYFMQMISWSTPSLYEKSKDDFDKMLNSIKLVDEATKAVEATK